MNIKVLLFGLLILSGSSFVRSQQIAVPDGYAGYIGTTGGGTATPITVSTAAEFKAVVNNNDPAVIIVNGLLDVGSVSIGSNKTIIGADENSGLYGGDIEVDGSNYIIQNLIFGPSGSDAMEVSGGTKVFITRCSFHDSGDELLSIVREADYVTVSWCKFYFDSPHDHAFAHLIGNSDDRTTDRGKLHVTMHHNWYAEGIRSRMPRVRYGHVHIYNNYYNSVGNNYCVGVGVECHIRLENTHFENVDDIWNDMGGADNGEMGWDNLILTGCTQPTFIGNTFPVFDPPYSYNMDPAEIVRDRVMAGAGNVFGGIYGDYPDVSITSPPDSASCAADSGITIEVEASIDPGIIEYVSFYSDTLLATDSIAPWSFTWENVKEGIHTIYATATDSNNLTGYSERILVFTGSGITIHSPKSGAKYNFTDTVTITAHTWSATDTVSRVDFYADTTILGSDDSAPYSYTWNDVEPGTYSLTARAVEKNDSISVSETVNIIVFGGPEGYEYCSPENDDCTYEGLYNIAYGAEGKFNYKYNVTGTVECSDDVFGDPISGEDKACWVQVAETPYVTITSPSSLSRFPAPANITFTVNTFDNDGTIDGVQFFRNGELIGVSVIEPFTFDWNEALVGSGRIIAVATDNEGNSYTSRSVIVTVYDATGIMNMDDGDMTLYPNPVTDELILHLGGKYSAESEFKMYNSLGIVIMNETLSGSVHRLDLKEIPSGIYIVTISTRQNTIIRKIIKN